MDALYQELIRQGLARNVSENLQKKKKLKMDTQRQGTLNPLLYIVGKPVLCSSNVIGNSSAKSVYIGRGGDIRVVEDQEGGNQSWHQSDCLLVLGSIPLMKSLCIIISRGKFMAKKLNLISFLKLIFTNVSLGN